MISACCALALVHRCRQSLKPVMDFKALVECVPCLWTVGDDFLGEKVPGNVFAKGSVGFELVFFENLVIGGLMRKVRVFSAVVVDVVGFVAGDAELDVEQPAGDGHFLLRPIS